MNENPCNESDLLKINEAAELLRLRPSTLRSWVLKREKIPFVKLSGRVLFRRGDLMKFIEDSTVPIRQINEPKDIPDEKSAIAIEQRVEAEPKRESSQPRPIHRAARRF